MADAVVVGVGITPNTALAEAAGLHVNVWDRTDTIADLVRSGARVDRNRLADPKVDLADITTGAHP